MRITSIQWVVDSAIHYGGLAMIHGTILALITWLLSATVLRKCRPSLHAVLWTLVLVKFLVPPILPGEMVLSRWISEVGAIVTGPNAKVLSTPQRMLPSLPSPIPAVEPAGNELIKILFVAYVGCVAFIILRSLAALRSSRKRFDALPLADEEVRLEVQTLATRMGLKKAPEIRISSGCGSPFVFGLLRVTLVLPQQLMCMLKPSERQALIVHELAHIRRKDPIVRALEGLARICFFFFPPVLWVCRRREQFSEMACDRWAISISGVKPDAYAGALIKVVKQASLFRQVAEGLPLVRGVKSLETRIRHVLLVDARRSSPHLSPVLKGILICWSLFVLAGGAHSERLDGVAGAGFVSHANAVWAAPSSKNESDRSGERYQPQQVARPVRLTQEQRPTREKPVRLEGVYSNEELTAARQAYETRHQQGEATQVDSNGLSPFEEGYLLGSRFSRERSRGSQPATSPRQANRAGLQSDDQIKREIEMRAVKEQSLANRPPIER